MKETKYLKKYVVNTFVVKRTNILTFVIKKRKNNNKVKFLKCEKKIIKEKRPTLHFIIILLHTRT